MLISIYEKRHKSVFLADIQARKSKDWEKWFLVSSDHHFDSKKSNRMLIRHHLNQARERNADVLMIGDFFDCMQGKYDPRGNKADIRDELKVPNYFDALVEQAGEFLAPYKENIKLLTKGNHETSVLKHQEVDLIERLGSHMNLKYGAELQTGGYAGYVILRFYTDLVNRNGMRKKVLMTLLI